LSDPGPAISDPGPAISDPLNGMVTVNEISSMDFLLPFIQFTYLDLGILIRKFSKQYQEYLE
jgi:hypothetical protein